MKISGKYFFGVFFLCAAHTWAQPKEKEVQFLSEGKLIIEGTSNVNKFDCILEHSMDASRMVTLTSLPAGLELNNAVLTFEVDDFDCGGKEINKDFKEALKGEKHPEIYMTIQKIYLDMADTKVGDIVKTDIQLDLAGVKRAFTVEIENLSIDEKTIAFKGAGDFTMSQFDVTPPQALWGLIKVDDEIVINFDFSLKFDE